MNWNPTPTTDLVDPNVEGAFRRGYAHAIAEVAMLLKANPKLSAEQLKNWERTKIDTWRKDMPLVRQIPPPEFF